MPTAEYIRVEREVHAGLYGDQYTEPLGHWIILRWYKIGEFSKYWDPDSKQAIGGPKWKYRSFPLRTVYSIGTSPAGGTRAGFVNVVTRIPGDIELDKRVYLIERCFRPKVGDHIFEFECGDVPDESDKFVIYASKNRSVKFKINNIEAIRTDGSKIIYYLAFATLDQSRV